MKNNQKQNQYKTYERNGQLVLALNSEKIIEENAPVRLTNAQLEELDYRKLYSAYSPIGRKSAADARVMFKILVYGYQCGIYSSRKLEEACRYRIDFMWLLEDRKAPDHSTLSRFRTGRCRAVVEELFYQYVKKLERDKEVDHREVFIDGTKLESRAGRYTFCWRGSVEKNLSRVKAAVFGQTGQNNTAELRRYLEKQAEGICFVYGRGKRKSEEQRAWENLSALCKRWEDYEESLRVMGASRNSYSKTDPDATFMRLKEDHMRNGQLKPAYNVQLAVNSEYITGIEAFSDRTDSRTLKPFLHRMEQFQQARYESVVADAGYESMDNYLYLDGNGQSCFIKPTNYEQKKTHKFRKQIGRIENMRYDEIEDCFVCAQGRKLGLRREETALCHGQLATTAWYRCESCLDCPQRADCCKAKEAETAKEIMLRKTFWQKRAQTEERITTPQGIHLRLCRSIQVEGAFGLLKNDFAFRRFLTRGRENIRTELFLLAMAFNLKKLWMKREKGRLQTRYSEKLTA